MSLSRDATDHDAPCSGVPDVNHQLVSRHARLGFQADADDGVTNLRQFAQSLRVCRCSVPKLDEKNCFDKDRAFPRSSALLSDLEGTTPSGLKDITGPV